MDDLIKSSKYSTFPETKHYSSTISIVKPLRLLKLKKAILVFNQRHNAIKLSPFSSTTKEESCRYFASNIKRI